MTLNCIGRRNVSGGVWIVRLSFMILHTTIAVVTTAVIVTTIATAAVTAAQKNTITATPVAPA
jgi:hypothetical protein